MSVLMIMLSLLGQSCECDEQRTVEEEFAVAARVFVGTVKSVNVPHWDPSKGVPRSNDYRFSVSRTFKGPAVKTATVSVQPLSPCAYSFILEQKYLVYVFSHPMSPRVLTTSTCSRTVPIEDAEEDLDILPELSKEREEE